MIKCFSIFIICFIIESKSVSNVQINPHESLTIINESRCYYTLQFFLYQDFAEVYCNKYQNISYDDFANHQFIVYSSPVFFERIEIKEKNIADKMEMIIKSIQLKQRKEIYFYNFSDYDKVLSFIYFFSYSDVEFWIQINSNSTKCIWEKQKLDDLERQYSNSKWRLACLDNVAMLHYNNNNETIEMILVESDVTLILIISVIVAFFLILISTSIIASCKRSKSQVEHELD